MITLKLLCSRGFHTSQTEVRGWKTPMYKVMFFLYTFLHAFAVGHHYCCCCCFLAVLMASYPELSSRSSSFMMLNEQSKQKKRANNVEHILSLEAMHFAWLLHFSSKCNKKKKNPLLPVPGTCSLVCFFNRAIKAFIKEIAKYSPTDYAVNVYV